MKLPLPLKRVLYAVFRPHVMRRAERIAIERERRVKPRYIYGIDPIGPDSKPILYKISEKGIEIYKQP